MINPTTTHPKTRAQIAYELRAQGYTLAHIAQTLNISTQRVQQLASTWRHTLTMPKLSRRSKPRRLALWLPTDAPVTYQPTPPNLTHLHHLNPSQLTMNNRYLERAKLAFDLHYTGHNYSQIAEQLQLHPTRARALVTTWRTHLERQSEHTARYGSAAQQWPLRLLNALRANQIENIDHLHQIIKTHGLTCVGGKHFRINGGNYAFNRIGDSSWVNHIIPYFASISQPLEPYITRLPYRPPVPPVAQRASTHNQSSDF